MSVLLLIALLALAGEASASVSGEFSEGVEHGLVIVDGGQVGVDVVGRPDTRVFAWIELPDDYEGPDPLLEIEVRFDRIGVTLLGVGGAGVELMVEVPETTDLRVRAANGGPVKISNVSGDLDVLNSNAGVELLDVNGSATVATSNGPIVATFGEITPTRPMSFLTSNGRIDVTLPASLEADVYMETDNGRLESEFEILVGSGAARDRLERRGERIKVVKEGAIGGGGPLLRFRTDNDSIYVRSGALD